MTRALLQNPRVAAVACALVACVWLNQGPSAAGYDVVSAAVAAGDHPWLAVWRPFAFAYRRAQGEEVFYALANAVRGAPYDADVVRADRGEAPAAFRRLPDPDGRWHTPYAEVPFEYPALFLPVIALPALLAGSFPVFAWLFGALMGGFVVAAVAVAASVRKGATPAERASTYWLAALVCLAQGGLLVQRLDAVPAFLLAVALWAAVRGRALAFGLAVGAAAAAKVLPIVVLLPMWVAARPSPERAAGEPPWSGGRIAAGVATALTGCFVLPMLALSPRGLADFLAYHGARGLHVESTWGVALSIVDLALGQGRPATRSFGSYNLAGPVASVFAGLATPTVALLAAGLSLWVARLPPASGGRERTERIANAGLGALLCAWLAAKVCSPQYLTWGIPFVVALGPPRRLPIAAAFAVALTITQIYLRGFYDAVTDVRPLGVAALALRVAALVVLTVLVGRALGYAAGRKMRATPNAA